ncbi:O-methyltransferase-domain-containing protein [Apiospora kogelbergensis]|uniref:O-methyltransferase-domain-containing protein n=1 Tax=Apiospora kogelbergensis TaxID=1337665 RepID=UPI00312ED608
MALEALAEATGSDADILGQVLHILCAQGIFRYEDGTGRYANSTASSLLCSDHWTQWHNWATMYGTQFYDIARGIPAVVVRKGDDDTTNKHHRSAAQVNYDTDEDMFSYFRTRGWVPELHRTLSGGAAAQMPGILADYPWGEVGEGLVMDIGGGQGQFLAGLLRTFPRMRGGLFDRPHIIEHARPFFSPGGQYSDVGERIADVDMVGGDFFQFVPPAAVYTMKWCLHDWKDEQAVDILRKIHQSMTPGPNSRLILLESFLADSHSGRLSQYGNINMMMTIGGKRERRSNGVIW